MMAETNVSRIVRLEEKFMAMTDAQKETSLNVEKVNLRFNEEIGQIIIKLDVLHDDMLKMKGNWKWSGMVIGAVMSAVFILLQYFLGGI